MPHLFEKFNSFNLIEYQKKQLIDAVRNLREHELKGTDSQQWIQFFNDKFFLDVPRIKREEINIDVNDTKVDARYTGDRFYYRDSGQPIMIDATLVTLYIPYEGDKELFQCSGNSVYHSPPQAEIGNEQLTLSYRYTDHNPEKINSDIKKDVDYIEGFLQRLSNQLKPFNDSISQLVSEHLNSRIEKLKKDEDLKSKLAFPLRPRNGVAQTYQSSAVRSKISIQKPVPTKSTSIPPEPVLADADYNEILKICNNMTLVMEKSPHAFKSMGEEDIRQHFLVQLNGRFEGSATGETFNFEGKTDILVKDGNKNVFIAECKFWKGPKTIKETIDQLLGYTSWRDTKTAIFLFSRNKSFSEVISQIPDLVKAHPNFIREIKENNGSETEFRYLFSQVNDSQRRLIVTILAFDIPS